MLQTIFEHVSRPTSTALVGPTLWAVSVIVTSISETSFWFPVLVLSLGVVGVIATPFACASDELFLLAAWCEYDLHARMAYRHSIPIGATIAKTSGTSSTKQHNTIRSADEFRS